MKNSLTGLTMVLLASSLNVSSQAQTRSDTVKAMDTDHDQKISLEEYLSFAKDRSQQKHIAFDQAHAEKTFQQKDSNQDGFLTSSELMKQQAQKPKKPTMEEQKKRIAEEKNKKAEAEEKKKEQAKKEKEERKKAAAEKKSESQNSDDD